MDSTLALPYEPPAVEWRGELGQRAEIVWWIVFVGFALDACLLATTLDALYRGYEVVVLRDCTLACDKPDEASTLSFTKRMVTWIEMMVGRTATSQAFIQAVGQATVEPSARQESPN